MSATRPMRRVATALTGLLVLGVAAGAAMAGEYWAVPEVPTGAAQVAVDATDTRQVCAGPPRLATAAAGQDLAYDEFDPEGSGTDTVVAALTLGREGGSPGGLQLHPTLEVAGGEPASLIGELRSTELADIGRAALLEAEPVDGELALATGTSIALTRDGDLRGLTAAACQAPATSLWLVGGSTAPGDSAQLVLANAGDTAASVTLRGWGSTGPLDLAGAGNVLVPARGERVVLLEALTSDPRPALQVEATGGEVTAALQDSRLRGLVPGGTDFVTPGAAPAEELVIPGIVLDDTMGEGEDAPAVRVANPGEEPALVTLDLLGPDGVAAVPGAEDLVLDPGAVIDVSLAGLPQGTWAARVSGDVPLVAAAVLTAQGEVAEGQSQAAIDFFNDTATTEIYTGLVALPQAEGLVGSAVLSLANPSEERVDVVVVPLLADGTRGEPAERALEPQAAVALTVADLAEEAVAGLEIHAEQGAVHAALLLAGQAPDGPLLSGLSVTEDAQTALAVDVVPALRTLR